MLLSFNSTPNLTHLSDDSLLKNLQYWNGHHKLLNAVSLTHASWSFNVDVNRIVLSPQVIQTIN